MENKMLTTKEACKQLNCTQRTIYNYINRGDLKVIRIGKRKILISQEKLNNFLGVRNGNN